MIDTPQILSEAMLAAGLDNRALRKRLIAEGLNVSRQRMHRWLKGDAAPEASALAALCHALQLDGMSAVRLYHASGVPLPAMLIPANLENG